MNTFAGPSARYRAGDARTRLASAALALAITALVVWLLATLGVFEAGPSGRKAGALTTMSFDTGQRAETTRAEQATKPKSAPRATRTARATAPRPPIVPPTPTTPIKPVPWIQIGRNELAMVDSAMTTSHARSRASSAAADAGGGSAGAAGDSAKAGTGPSGETLYAADWYRKPRDSELAYYIPSGVPEKAWGEIACRTASAYQVKDCVPLGESPPGTGLARKLVEAAWQFRVLPPRVNRRPLVGSWVRIHFDFSKGAG